MGKLHTWTNVDVRVQNNSLVAAKTVTALTKAAEGVASSTAHGFLVGDYVAFSVGEGMVQLDRRVARVKAVTTDTFTLEGINTTAMDTWEAGTAQLCVFGYIVTTAATVGGSQAQIEFDDATTIHTSTRRMVPVMTGAGSFEMEHFWDPSDVALAGMKSLYEAQREVAVKFQWGTGGRIMVFKGFVATNLLPGGEAQKHVKTNVSFTLYGQPTYYAS